MEKIRLYTFAICAIAAIGIWIIAVGSAILSIGQLGFVACIVLITILTLMLGLPLLFLAGVLGISNLANR